MTKIISIDGGGIKGIVGATILNALETKLQKPIYKCTDIITGTSTGGLIACGLTAPDENGNPKWNTADVMATYETMGNDVFSSSFWHKVKTLWGLIGPKYPLEGLEKVMLDKIGDTKLTEALIQVVISTYDLHQRRPVVFSSKDHEEGHLRMVDLCLGTSSVPVYFPTVKVDCTHTSYNLIDGGVFAVNPALCALAIAKKKKQNETVEIVSIGNGNFNKSLPYEKTKSWGLLQWGSPAVEVIIDGIGDAIDHQTKVLCEADGGRYVRLQFDIPEKLSNMDNADSKNIKTLKEITLNYLSKKPKEFQDALDILK